MIYEDTELALKPDGNEYLKINAYTQSGVFLSSFMVNKSPWLFISHL